MAERRKKARGITTKELRKTVCVLASMGSAMVLIALLALLLLRWFFL
jgi:hypothetical protein